MNQTITALFDTRASAEAALQQLIKANVPRASIRLLPKKAGITPSQSATGYDYTRDEGGFWASLKDVLIPEEDRYAYSEGLSRGNAMLLIEADQSQVHHIEELVEASHGTLDLDQQETTWRSGGWTGYQAASTGTTKLAAGSASAASSAAAATRSVGDRDETISLYEEKLNIGKRVTDRGRVRLRSYVVETPVSEQVTLRDETVHVDRHPVDRAVTAADSAALFGEKVIEAEEHDEEAIVGKTVRVKEEIGLRKTAEERVQTVQDTVRHTEVEVEDTRVDGTASTTSVEKTAPRKSV